MHILEGELSNVKADIADLKDHLASVTRELDIVTDGGIEAKLLCQEEEMIQMKNHFTSMIKQLNQIAAFVNKKHGYRIIEETAEFGTTPPPNSPRDNKYNLRSHVIDIE